MKNVTITKTEKAFIEALIPYTEEPGYSSADVSDLATEMKMTKNQVKGIMGSLVKKGIIDAPDSDFAGIIYLSLPAFNLHPDWWKEVSTEGYSRMTSQEVKDAQFKITVKTE